MPFRRSMHASLRRGCDPLLRQRFDPLFVLALPIELDVSCDENADTGATHSHHDTLPNVLDQSTRTPSVWDCPA